MADIIKEILKKIPETKISLAAFEGANIVLYTKDKDFFLDNKGVIKEIVDEFKKRGIEVLQTGQVGKQKFVYLDTEKTFGVLLEISTTLKRRKKK